MRTVAGIFWLPDEADCPILLHQRRREDYGV